MVEFVFTDFELSEMAPAQVARREMVIAMVSETNSNSRFQRSRKSNQAIGVNRLKTTSSKLSPTTRNFYRMSGLVLIRFLTELLNLSFAFGQQQQPEVARDVISTPSCSRADAHTSHTALNFSNVGTPHWLKEKMNVSRNSLHSYPSRIRSLEWNVYLTGQSDSKQRLWAELVQLHERGSHTDQSLWQSQKFPRRRHHNLHHRGSWRFSAFRSIQQQQANRSMQSCHNVGIFGCELLETAAWVGWQSCGRSGNWCWSGWSLLVQLFHFSQKGRDIGNKTSCIRWKRENLQNHWTECWLGRPRSEWLSEKLYQDESEVEASLSDFDQIKQADGHIMLREMKLVCMENWNWGLGSSKRVMQRIAKQLKNRGEFVAKKLIVRRQRMLRSWIRKQLWSIPRSWSNFYDPEFQDLTALRFWIAAKYPKL